MKALVLFTAATLLASPAVADSSGEIRAANARWSEAVAHKDMATVEAIVAPGFRLTSGTARADQVTARDRWLANLRNMQIASYKTEITDLEIHGDTALATISGSWNVAFGDVKLNEPFELVDFWVRGPSGWQVVRRHITSPE